MQHSWPQLCTLTENHLATHSLCQEVWRRCSPCLDPWQLEEQWHRSWCLHLQQGIQESGLREGRCQGAQERQALEGRSAQLGVRQRARSP